MAFWKVTILSIISIIMMLSSSYYYLFSFVFNFYIVRRLRVCYILCSNTKVILTTEKNLPDHLKNEFSVLRGLIIFSFVSYCISLFLDHIIDGSIHRQVIINFQVFIITILFWGVIFWLKKLTKSEFKYLSLVNNLTYGYGGAIWYYKNYLNRILPGKFKTAVNHYRNEQIIKLAKKLYILCPMSCKVQQHIDETDNIEYARNLPIKIDHGGIKDRVYCVSVYRIEHDEEHFHCAVEYAQPLKTLLSLKEDGNITVLEMHAERETFIKNLRQMLEDRENSFEVCELVEYDDEKEEIHTVLSNLDSLQKYKIGTTK